MRRLRVRTAIEEALKEKPEGMTALQIFDTLDKKSRRTVANAKHVSRLIRGMKNISVKGVTPAIENNSCWSSRGLNRYDVNVYLYEEEGGEI